MSTVFELHRRGLEDYQDFVWSFVHIYDDRLQEFVQRAPEREAGSSVMRSFEQAAWAPRVAPLGYLLSTRTEYAYFVLVIRTQMR